MIIRRHRESGMVLIMALVALAVMSVLLLALFGGTQNQMRGAQLDASLAREKMLADSAVALVVGQIAQASTRDGEAWISQPGLLRTYAAARVPTHCYKLYSTPDPATMIDTSGSLAFLGADVPANWSALPSEYTDLNAPVVSAGKTIYPILDPGATNTISGVAIDSGHAAEMPVAWMYQLQDGTLGPASNGTPGNPIVARIAFWTDDETCKIDINTAGAGSPWNTPRSNSTNDVAWSTTQPEAGEFSAYPGHPATTSLGLALNSPTNAFTPQQLLGLTPRYAWGGSQFGAQTTSSGLSVAPKTNRLYSSVDELCFGATFASDGSRQTNIVSADEVNLARFVLTAHSQAPETTLLGEPRVAIWPVADSGALTTATDRAMTNAATVGTRRYYFQRNNPLDPMDDFDPSSTSTNAAAASNVQLFSDLINRGNVTPPGSSSNFATKYSGAAWRQLLLEIADFIHGLNAVDPSPSMTPFAAENANHIGRGYVDPLQWTYGSGTSAVTLRGFGRSPTLSSLTLVFYVSGFNFNDGTHVDFDELADDANGTTWKKNFVTTPTKWKNVVSERIRAFVVPCTFHPACGFPEVSDACTIQIQGLDGLKVTSGTNSGGFAFPPTATSAPLGTPPTKLTADRAWGGNDGPLAWRMAADAYDNTTIASYVFAGTGAFFVPMTTTTAAKLDPTSGGSNSAAWPPANALSFAGLTGLKVSIVDTGNHVLQTITLNLPAFTANAPTINGECLQADAIPPAASNANWTASGSCTVFPSWYMSLAHRLGTSQASRALMIQAGDVSRGVECATDLRLVAGLSAVPASMFHTLPYYTRNSINAQQGSHSHNLRFADGTSACFATDDPNAGITHAVATAAYPTTPTVLINVASWHTAGSAAAYKYYAGPPCSVPSGTAGLVGDWDTGPGYSTDGALINLPDAGTALSPAIAYQSLGAGQIGAATQRTPNALVPSPVIFGSLPTGINPSNPASSAPWQTLLFCPYPAANTSATPYAIHPGATSPPDHLLLDNFWMPAIEPYAISTCMTTAGKINLNDQIAPFTYIHRSTGLRAVLDAVRIPALSASYAATYKVGGPSSVSVWSPIDADATLAQIENKFASNSVDAYLSESEICTVPLVPKLSPAFTGDAAAVQTALANFWNVNTPPLADGQLTGDNLRELPYAQIYSRLTTRSNSYTVHLRVQVLKKLTRDPDQNVWKEGTDLILGDWRGSYEIERYLDPDGSAPIAGSRLGPYKFRTVSARSFAP